MLEALKLFNGLCSHYPVSVFSPCLLRVLPNGGTNRFIWDGNYSSFKQWAHHQITTEGWANMNHVVSTSRTWARGRQNGPINQCQIILQACLSFVSTILFLPVSICFLSAWWLMGSLVEYHVSVSAVRFACSGSALSFSEQRQRETRERCINWRVSCFIRSFQTCGNGRKLGWHCCLTSFSNASKLSTFEYGMMKQFHPLKGTDVCCEWRTVDNKETITIR